MKIDAARLQWRAFPLLHWTTPMNPTRRRTLLCAAALLPLPALAIKRGFPRGALRGQMLFVHDKEVVVNGMREKLSPGTRVYDERNRPPLRGALDGKTFTVNYMRDRKGIIREIWLLTPQEAQQPLPADAATKRYEQGQLQRMNQIYRN